MKERKGKKTDDVESSAVSAPSRSSQQATTYTVEQVRAQDIGTVRGGHLV